VPDVRGKTQAQADVLLRHAHLKSGRIGRAFSDTVLAGQVVSTTPATGTKTRRGSGVALVVSKGPDVVSMPHLAGMSLDDARAAIAQAGLRLGDVSNDFDASVPKGKVVSQEPSVGPVKRGTAVGLVVSKGPEMIEVPGVSGQTADQAKAVLAGAGFTVARSDDWSDTVAEGSVIRTSPGGGQKAPKGSAVTVVASKGPKPFAMPNLTGMSRADAKARISSLGLVLGNEYAVPGSGKPSGQVQGQNPPAGTQVRKGSRVDLYYAA
jgi:serine/threonine-protein kinase